MNLPRILLAGAVISMLSIPAYAAEAGSKATTDPAIDCGVFYIIMAEQTDDAGDAENFTSMSNLLLNEVDTRLSQLGVSIEERQRIGGEAKTRMLKRMEADDVGITFSNCHVAMERAVDAAMPNVLSKEARNLLTCGSQFIHARQSFGADDETNTQYEAAYTDQLQRAVANMTETGISSEEQDHIVTFFALSAAMVLVMGEDPIVAWEDCGEL